MKAMKEKSMLEPRSAMIFPTRHDMPRAGTPTEQIALQNQAWTVLEKYVTTNGRNRTRLSNNWLGDKGWRVQLVGHHDIRKEEGVDRLAAAASTRGHRTLLGTVVQPGDVRVSAVWQIPSTAEPIAYFFGSHYPFFHMLFARDLSFAVHANDGDFAVFAGPTDWLREALPAKALGPEATAWVKSGVEEEHGEGCMAGIIKHYEPFMLD